MKKDLRFSVVFLLMVALLGIDIAGYIIIEGVSFLDAFYMTAISITTVGFKEVFPLSAVGRIFTVFVIISGIGLFFYIAVSIAESTVEERIRKILGRRKMKTLAKLSSHIIISGFGRMRKIVASELTAKDIRFVII